MQFRQSGSKYEILFTDNLVNDLAFVRNGLNYIIKIRSRYYSNELTIAPGGYTLYLNYDNGWSELKIKDEYSGGLCVTRSANDPGIATILSEFVNYINTPTPGVLLDITDEYFDNECREESCWGNSDKR